MNPKVEIGVPGFVFSGKEQLFPFVSLPSHCPFLVKMFYQYQLTPKITVSS